MYPEHCITTIGKDAAKCRCGWLIVGVIPERVPRLIRRHRMEVMPYTPFR